MPTDEIPYEASMEQRTPHPQLQRLRTTRKISFLAQKHHLLHSYSTSFAGLFYSLNGSSDYVLELLYLRTTHVLPLNLSACRPHHPQASTTQTRRHHDLSRHA